MIKNKLRIENKLELVKSKAKIEMKKNLKIVFIILCALFAVPSICYYINKGTILNFDRYYQFLLNNTDIMKQTECYILILTMITLCYILIIKNRKELFKNIKSILIIVAIVSAIFIVVIPFTSSDVFYYLGIGRLDCKYGQNPYYTTIKQYVDQENNSKYIEEDSVLEQGYNNPWSDTTVVYGPVWTLICKMVSAISFGNIDIALLTFKIMNALIHILNCYLIYKISNKKVFALLYGLNPFLLLEAIANVHNDIYMILFALLSFYFLIKKKNIVLSVIALSIATSIKYFTILLLPFIIIYYFRKEKPGKRLLRCIEYGIIFLITCMACYIVYIRDLQVFSGLFTQQQKFAKSIYIMITEYFNDIPNIVEQINQTLLATFVIIYFFTCIILLHKKQIKLTQEMKQANYYIMAFLFLLITNFQPWYIMWLFICFIWQKADIIKLITVISILSQFANSVFLMYNENWRYGTPFVFIMAVGGLTTVIVNQNIRKIRIKKAYLRRKQIG